MFRPGAAIDASECTFRLRREPEIARAMIRRHELAASAQDCSPPLTATPFHGVGTVDGELTTFKIPANSVNGETSGRSGNAERIRW